MSAPPVDLPRGLLGYNADDCKRAAELVKTCVDLQIECHTGLHKFLPSMKMWGQHRYAPEAKKRSWSGGIYYEPDPDAVANGREEARAWARIALESEKQRETAERV